nr:MAG TPA: tail protein [Caudoviricetes sp.]
MWQVFLNDFQINDQLIGMHLDEPIEGLAGLPAIRTSQGTNLGANGGWTTKQLYEPRFISFSGRIFGRTVAEVEDRRREFSTILAKIVRNKGTLRIITPAGNVYSTEIVLIGVDMPINKVLNLVEWKINLKADDPLLYDNSDGELLATIRKTRQGGFIIPFELPLYISPDEQPATVNNSGNETILPNIIISTKATNPKIINRTTNQSMEITAVVKDGGKLEIDMKNKTILLDGMNIYDLQTAGSNFWGLIAGDNRIELQTDIQDERTEAELRFRSGFIGI